MSDPKAWLSRVVVGNPVYLLSAMVMMYATTVLLTRGHPVAGEVSHILLAYGSVQLYEFALIALAVWITLKLDVPEDGATLLILESLLIGAAFITFDELLAADYRWGLIVAGAGLVLAAVKLAVAKRPLRVPIPAIIRVLVWIGFALPLAWIPRMKADVVEPLYADWTAYLAWWSFAALIIVGVIISWMAGAQRWSRSTALASLVLSSACILSVGGHLFSLHHSFLASSQLWWIAPALVAVAFAILWAVLATGKPWSADAFALSWLPFFALALFFGQPGHRRQTDWSAKPVALVGFEIAAVYACLLVMTRRKLLTLHLAIAAALALGGDRREVMVERAIASQGWWLTGLAFLLLAAGAVLTLVKHRRRMTIQAFDSNSPT